MATTVVIVGGGVAGVTAALRVRELAPAERDLRIEIIESTDRLGGKLRTEEFAGGWAEAGAEAFVMRGDDGGPSPAARLVQRVGLGEALRHPATTQAALAIGHSLRPMPAGTLMGVPADPAGISGLARVHPELDRDGGAPLLGPEEDVAVGALVRGRLGAEVVDHLVDPLLGGVYAGRADDLSLAVTIPALAQACRSCSTLTGAVRAVLSRRRSPGTAPAAGTVPGGPAPIFGAIDGGMSRLVEAAAERSGARLRLGRPVRELHRDGYRWRLVVGSTRDPETVEADAVVLAVPARPAARLLSGVSPEAAALVGELDYASVALVTLALPDPGLPPLSGFLVPATEGYGVKAVTNFTTKWAHQSRPDRLALVRASVGRYGDERLLQRDDAGLVELVRAELDELYGQPLPVPLATRVTRWGGALPQYRPGHLDRIAAARAALAGADTLALAGAGYDGVGIAACVRSGETAAEHVSTALAGLKT